MRLFLKRYIILYMKQGFRGLNNLRIRQNVCGYILIGFSFLILTFLTVKVLVPEINTNAATQTASETIGPWSLSMANDSEVNIDITPTATQTIYSATNNLSVTNSCTAGATITMNTNSEATNSLVRSGSDTATKEIPATTTTSLDDNSWGYALNNSSTYYAVPKKGAPAATIYNGTAAQTTALTVPVKFGVKVDNNIPSGTYTNDVIYTMTPNAGCLTYSVTWDLDGGTAASGKTYPTSLAWGATVNLKELKPTRDGYTFAGWTNGSSNYTGNETSANLNSGNATTVTVKAKWTATNYTISYTLNSGSVSGNPTSYNIETATFTLNNPTRSGYNFTGWSGTGISGKSTSVSIAKGSTGDRNYTANWEVACTGIGCISTMQAMTSALCSATATGTSKTLTDTRDNKTYTVKKLADGKCWMTQNLRLIGKTLTSSDSNISASSWTLPAANWSGSTDSTAKYTNAYTYDTGNTDYGVYYNYAAATAGTISGTSNSTEATYDICPKGWKLPSQSQQAALLSAYNVTNDAAGSTIMRSAPLNFVYSGNIAYASTSPSYQGTSGHWWSSTANSTTNRYRIYIASSIANATNGNTYRRSGLSVRCVAK